jgi:Icc-related predicted phosphoesterase
MVRIAAIGDLHYDRGRRGWQREQFDLVGTRADLLLIAGDLTQHGEIEEAQALADDLSGVTIPVVAVLGNHDFHRQREGEIIELLRARGVHALEAQSRVFEVDGSRVGVMGIKGFGGGFAGACVTEFGERETKEFARCAHEQARLLRLGLEALDCASKFVLTHYAPIEETLTGERCEIYPFLGSYLLAEAVDASGVTAVFHGHAHHGIERGQTPGGIPVRNVAQPVLRRAYGVYSFESPGRAKTG